MTSLFHKNFGRRILRTIIRVYYFYPIRRLVFWAARHWLGTTRALTLHDGSAWEKFNEQYRWISLAALQSVERAIEKRWLSAQVACRISELWGSAFFPTKERQLAIQEFRLSHGVEPPWFLVISPTRACNLKCSGCYANSGPGSGYSETASLRWDTLDRLITEAKQTWGIRLFVFSGGEPLAYRSQGKDLLDIVEKHADCLFLMFTNGTLIKPEVARRLARLGNLTPALSVEGMQEETDQRRGAGAFEQVLASMERLRQAGVPFGISLTATRANCEQVLAEQLLDFFFAGQGAFYAFVFQYMPIGRFPNFDWMPTPDQRLPFWTRSWEVVRQRRHFLLDFWNHGPLVEGCIAAGREKGYMHVDWNGDVMPCVFMPLVAANLNDIYDRGGSLNDVWESPLFREVRRWQNHYGYGCTEPSKDGNWILACPFRDHYSVFQDWMHSPGTVPQEGVASSDLMSQHFCDEMCAYGAAEAQQGQRLWETAYLNREAGDL